MQVRANVLLAMDLNKGEQSKSFKDELFYQTLSSKFLTFVDNYIYRERYKCGF